MNHRAAEGGITGGRCWAGAKERLTFAIPIDGFALTVAHGEGPVLLESLRLSRAPLGSDLRHQGQERLA